MTSDIVFQCLGVWTRRSCPLAEDGRTSHSRCAITKPRRLKTRVLSVDQLYSFCASPLAALHTCTDTVTFRRQQLSRGRLAANSARTPPPSVQMESSSTPSRCVADVAQPRTIADEAAGPAKRAVVLLCRWLLIVPVIVQLDQAGEEVVDDLRHEHCVGIWAAYMSMI